MHDFSLELSQDETDLTVSIDGAGLPARLSAGDVDDLVRALAEHRARMKPVHAAEPPRDGAAVYTGDNLLWSVSAAPHRSAIELGVQHPGLGWIVMALSRAQIEDLLASIEFSLRDLREAPASSPPPV